MSVARIDSLRSVSGASITGSYQKLGSPITHNWRLFKITNNTDGDVIISFDGVTDNIFVATKSYTLYDLATNAQSPQNIGTIVISLNTQIWVRSSSTTSTGAVYLEGMFASGE